MKSILDAQHHARLIADIEHISQIANVPKQFIHTSMFETCASAEIEWVRNFYTNRAGGVAGLAMVGIEDAETRMMSMCGAFLRNFIDARIIPVNLLLAQQKAGNLPEPTVLLIPNLFIGKGSGIAKWQSAALYEILLSRFTANKPTVMFIENLNGLKEDYGSVFYSHINSHYQVIEG